MALNLSLKEDVLYTRAFAVPFNQLGVNQVRSLKNVVIFLWSHCLRSFPFFSSLGQCMYVHQCTRGEIAGPCSGCKLTSDVHVTVDAVMTFCVTVRIWW